MLLRFALVLFIAAQCFAAPVVMAEPPVTVFIYHSDDDPPPPGRSASRRENYTHELLRAVLDRTRAAYGPYELAPSPPMHEKFRALALERGDDGINISVFPSKRGYPRTVIPVRIPIDRGLMGYRVLTIRAADQPRFDAVRTADDLKQFHFGLRGGWIDVGIMQRDGFAVETGLTLNGLMHMLDAGRFDAFSNSPPPAAELLDRLTATYPGLVIEAGLLVHYPMPVYFWFRDTEDGRRRAERVRAGLEQMIRDGSMKALFDKWYGPALARLGVDRRRIVELPNPQLDPADPVDRPDLWYAPGENAPGR